MKDTVTDQATNRGYLNAITSSAGFKRTARVSGKSVRRYNQRWPCIFMIALLLSLSKSVFGEVMGYPRYYCPECDEAPIPPDICHPMRRGFGPCLLPTPRGWYLYRWLGHPPLVAIPPTIYRGRPGPVWNGPYWSR